MPGQSAQCQGTNSPLLLFPALPHTPSVRHEAGAGHSECGGCDCISRQAAPLGEEGDASLASAHGQDAGSAYGEG